MFILINFKYSQFNIGDKGQVLVALEFSRYSKRYRTIYWLYSTTAFNKSTKELFSSTAPYIAEGVAIYFGQ